MKDNHVILYDSTLRDGSQMRGVDFSVSDKVAIAKALDAFGIDYIEGGWPGANPRDDAFFANPPTLSRAKLTAFGMTRRAGTSAENDPTLNALLNVDASHVCLVGKTWDFHIEKALDITAEENAQLIYDSLLYASTKKAEVMFDAEHFFDGYKANAAVAMQMIEAAHKAGAAWLVLCDTNGGTMPEEIYRIVSDVKAALPEARLGIHCHNDAGVAVANSLAAVQAGVRHVQGTINGIGERCGNADLISIIPNLMLKMGYETSVTDAQLTRLTKLSRLIDERLDRPANPHLPYAGSAAFAHKGGLHVSAMAKDTRSYEHIPPEQVGNKREILISDKAGRANIVQRLQELDLGIDAQDERLTDLVRIVKERESEGFVYEGADASFALFVRRYFGMLPSFFEVESFRVVDERRWNALKQVVTLSEATIKLHVAGNRIMAVGEGNGPVNALDSALRSALSAHYPVLEQLRLIDYKVRILSPKAATAAITRVMIESADNAGNRWVTIGVSPNVIDASYNALHDAITYMLLQAE
jgi:2-isopropylmalate synthase